MKSCATDRKFVISTNESTSYLRHTIAVCHELFATVYSELFNYVENCFPFERHVNWMMEMEVFNPYRSAFDLARVSIITAMN